MSPLMSGSVMSDEVPGPLAAGTLMRTDELFAELCIFFPRFHNQALLMLQWNPPQHLAYVLCSLNNQWNMYLPASGSARLLVGPRQLHWKTNRRSTCLSVALSVVRVAQPDRLGRRSSTFTLPPCQTSRAVLVNEVAISYCSVKHLKLAWGRRGRCSDGGIKLLWRKDELGKERNADLQRRH